MKRVDNSFDRDDPRFEATVWSTLHPDARRICTRVLGAGPDADDIADAALVDFIERYLPRLGTLPAARSYLRLMVMRRAVRFAARRDRHEPCEPEHLVAEAAPTPEGLAATSVLTPRLEACLGELKPKARAALRLRFEAELTNEDIGTRVGGSRQYIGRLITASLTALRMCLERVATGIGSAASAGGR